MILISYQYPTFVTSNTSDTLSIRTILTYTIISLIYISLPAQQVLENVYDVATGLPFQETTFVHQDNNGYLWVEYSNEGYISRFDGITWTHFRFADYGMPPALTFTKETKEGMWLVNQDLISRTTDLVLRSHQNVWRRFSFRGLHIIDRFALADHMYYLDEKYRIYKYVDTSFIYTGYHIPDSFIGASYEVRGIQHTDHNYTLEMHLLSKDQNQPDFKVIIYNYVAKSVVFAEKRNFIKTPATDLTHHKYYFIHDRLRGYDIQNGNKTFPLNGIPENLQVLGFQLHKNSWTRAFASLNKKGKRDVYVFNDQENKLEKIYDDLYEGIKNSHLVKDQNNHLWYATHSGLFRRNPHIFTFSEASPGMVNGLHTLAEDDQGKIWFGGYNQSGWSYWDGQRLQRPDDKSLLANRVLPGSFRNGDKVWFFEETEDFKSLSYIKNNQLEKVILPEVVSPGFYFTKLHNGKMAAGLASKGLLIFDPEKPSDYTIKNKDDGLLLQNVLTISEDRSHKIWMGRMSQGIACYDPQMDTVVTWLVSPEDPNSLGMISSMIDYGGDLWMGTSKGLYWLNEPHHFDILKQTIFDHIVPVQLSGDYMDRVTSIAESQRYLIAASEKGIHLIEKNIPSDSEGRRRAYSLWYGEDIPGKGSEQNAILIDSKGYLWVGTNEGALRLDIHNMRFDTTPVILHLSVVKIGGSDVDLSSDRIIGPKGQRSIDISWNAAGNEYFQNNIFATILILKGKNDTIFYKNQTRDKNFTLPHLAPDTYRLIIKGYKNNQLGATLEKQIIIPKLLSERISFWAMMVLLLTLVPFVFLLNRSRSRRKDAEYKLKLEKAKRNQDSFRIKSLSNFFNPHFINNTLHWLQSKYRKDEETATMIDSLASNVELLYHNMQHGVAYHSLSKEINLVDNYLNIQQVRFDHMLHVKNNIGPNIVLENIPIPSMLMQIHVENAVEKGIRNREGAHEISITITEDGDFFKILIEDDGRGRLPKTTYDENRKGSTEVMNDLISILNLYNDKKILVTYDDRIIDQQYGTRVTILLPKNFNYAFEKI
jgi:ligand-binding sensor domain-containing protein